MIYTVAINQFHEEITFDSPDERIIPKTINGRSISSVGTHLICGGEFELRQVSICSNVLFCRSCGLRIHLPISVVTYSDLKAYFVIDQIPRRHSSRDTDRAEAVLLG